MNCPICNIPLTIAERRGVEIDYCSKCRGVWLDRGELDKIIERSAMEMPFRSYPDQQGDRHDRHDDKHHGDRYAQRDHHDRHDNHDHKRKRNFLHDLFD